MDIFLILLLLIILLLFTLIPAADNDVLPESEDEKYEEVVDLSQ